MKQTILAYLLLFLGGTVSGQVENVVDKVKDSYEHYESALKKITRGLEYIEDCYVANTIDDIQTYAGYAEDELSSAKRQIGYAEDEADDAEDEAASIECSGAESEASDAEDYFYSAKREIIKAMDELSNTSYEDDADALSSYLSNAKYYISNSIRDLNSAVDDLNNVLEELVSCNVNVKNYLSSSVSCDELFEFIKENGYKKGTISNYTMNSSWLKSVTAYSYEYNIYVVAEIKESEYSYSTNTYIFCEIPSRNWTNFEHGGYGDSNSYGKRFHKYIFEYKCDCE